MHYAPLRHGAAGPFDELILLVEAIQFLTLGVLLMRARLRRRMIQSDLKVKDSLPRRSGKSQSG